ncbi:MAG: hypothetical protein JW769_02975 [Parachlamydiales bacterium]|nr:hypothetical protein [Parachlamydiales bacterium]
MKKCWVLFLVFSWVSILANIDMQNISKRAYEFLHNNNDRDDEEALLYQFYSNEISKLDQKTLQENPELLFRKSVARLRQIGQMYSIEKINKELHLVQADLTFVTKYAPQESILFKAAVLKNQLISALLNKNPKKLEDLLKAHDLYQDTFLKKWATQPTARQKELRENVLLNIQNNPTIASSFYETLILMDDNADVALGYIPVDDIRILDIQWDDDIEQFVLPYQIRYRIPYATVTCIIDL